jgi:hypothetical protein
MKPAILLCTSLFPLALALALPAVSAARLAFCAGGDTGCLIATLGKFQAEPQQHHVLTLGAGTFALTRADNTVTDEGSNGLPALVGHVTIRGAGPDMTVIERAPGSPFFRLLLILDDAEVTIDGVTFQGGALDPDWFYRAGGIANHGTLTMRDSVIRNNSAWLGGGLGSDGAAHLIRVTIQHNAAEFVAAGIATNGPLTLDDCWIAENVSEVEAGIGIAPGGSVRITGSTIAGNIAIQNTAGGLGGVGDITLTRSLVMDNVAGARGGGIGLDNGTLTMRDVTILGNTAANFAGGLYTIAGEVEGTRVAIIGNSIALGGVGGGLQNLTATVRLRQSVIAGNTAPRSPDCDGALTLVGSRNVVGNREGCIITEE